MRGCGKANGADTCVCLYACVCDLHRHTCVSEDGDARLGWAGMPSVATSFVQKGAAARRDT
jgi:hypothetical protein